MAYSIKKGYEKESGSEWNDYMMNQMIEYGFTHEAFIPFMSSYRVSQGQSKKQVVGSVVAPAAAGFAITAWATGQSYVSLGSSAFTAITGVAPSTALAPLVPVVVTAAATTAFVEFHKKYEPKETTHQPSYWNSIAAAMAGTFGGMQYE
jgi:hypothetical protein